MIRPVVLLQILVLSLMSPNVLAATPSPGAEVLIEQGLALRRQGKSAEALERFQRAHALAPTPRTFGQMGLVEASLERWLDAEVHLSVSLANAADGWVRKNKAFLEHALDVSREHLGELIVTGPAGATVSVGDKLVGTLPAVAPARVVEGDVVVTATAIGFKPFKRNIAVKGGARVSVPLAFEPLDVPGGPVAARLAPSSETVPSVVSGPASGGGGPAALAPRRADGARPAWRTWTGAGLAAVGAGAVAWGIAWIAVDGESSCSTESGASPCRTVYNTRTAGWIITGAGVAAVAAGGIIFFTGRSGGADVALGAAPGELIVAGRF